MDVCENLYQDVKLFNQYCMFKIIDPRINTEHVSANAVSSFNICRIKEMIVLEEITARKMTLVSI